MDKMNMMTLATDGQTNLTGKLPIRIDISCVSIN